MNTGHTTFSTMHADSVQTVINRLENEPINVPRPMVQSLDVLCVQVLGQSGGERVRRAKTIAEIEGIDQRTGELDYSNSYAWDSVDDSFRSSSSDLLRRDQAGTWLDAVGTPGNSSTDSGSCDTSSRRESPTTVGSPRW